MIGNRYVRIIILSRTFQQLGIWVRNFAILLYVTDVTRNDPFYVSLISVAEYAPIFIFAFIGGTFADRWRPKRTMLGCDLMSALSAFIVLLVVSTGSWYALFGATFISAVLSQFSQPSSMKLFKQHVPEAQLQGVMAMFQSLMSLFMVIGPVLGTYVFQHYGMEVSISVMGFMFLSSAGILSLLPKQEEEQGNISQRSFLQELAAGLRYVWGSRMLRTLGFCFAVSGFAAGCIQPLAIFITMENLGQDKSFLQWLMMINGAAMLLGGGLLMSFAKKIKPQTMLACGLFVSGIGTILVGWSTHVWLTIVLQVITGLSYPSIHIGIQTMIMKNTSSEYVGRVGGALTPVFMGMMVIGMSLSGILKGITTLFSVYAASGLLFLMGSLLLLPIIRSGGAGKEASGRISSVRSE